MDKPPPDTASPDADALREAALAYLARYAATETGLLRVLRRRIDRWARRAREAGDDRDTIAARVAEATVAARAVVMRLAAAGAVDDAAFAASKARNLARAGRSRRAIEARLAAKGVGNAVRRQVLAEGGADEELAAALVLARRRRIGPFRAGDPADDETRPRELGILARAGFPREVAERALALGPEEAAAAIDRSRR